MTTSRHRCELAARLLDLWAARPSERFCQLIMNIARDTKCAWPDIWECTDRQFLKALEKELEKVE